MIQNSCIFCESSEREFTAREHIVPESLGNTEHMLPPGIVCDWCNNYFARKVEAPVLNSAFFTQARNRARIPNKRRNIPPIDVLSYPAALHLQLAASTGGERSIYATNDADNDAFVEMITNRKRFSVVFPVPELPSGRLFARFLAMMALEAWAKKILDSNGDLHVDLIDKPELDEIRDFARFGNGNEAWAYTSRRLYPEDHHFVDDEGTTFDVLHEYTLLYTDANELYFVIAILGIEFAINLGGPEIDGYNDWLKSNHGRSPLYPNGM